LLLLSFIKRALLLGLGIGALFPLSLIVTLEYAIAPPRWTAPGPS